LLAGSTEHIDKYVQLGMAGALILAGLIGCMGAILGSIKVMVVVSSQRTDDLSIDGNYLVCLGCRT